MNNSRSKFGRSLSVAAVLTALAAPAFAVDPTDTGKILVANRTSGTLSVIDVATDEVIKTVSVATRGARPPEPMYVNYVPGLKRVFVSDRANKYVAVYDSRTFDLLDTAPLGKGAFHMWSDPKGKQLWSVNDIDKTLSVINPKTLALIDANPATKDVIDAVALPAELVAAGGKPHDIALDNAGKAAFVSVIGVPGKGYVLRYDTRTRKLTHQVEVGVDPHIGLGWKKPIMYVACQGNNTVYVLSTKDLKPLHEPIANVPGAHGTGMKHKDNTFYTTNFTAAANAANGLQAISLSSNTVTGSSNTGNEDVPHNIAITANDSKLYVTHSGHGDGEIKGVVTVYDVRDDTQPKYLKTIPVGLNPFGIAYIGPKGR
jgi:YVTN family beta-propeller protein